MTHPRKRRYRSAASKRQAHSRRAGWLEWRSQRHHLFPTDRIWLLARFTQLLAEKAGLVHDCANEARGSEHEKGRARDIFPLALLGQREYNQAIGPVNAGTCCDVSSMQSLHHSTGATESKLVEISAAAAQQHKKMLRNDVCYDVLISMTGCKPRRIIRWYKKRRRKTMLRRSKVLRRHLGNACA